MIPLERRLERFILPEPNSGCWLWTGAINQDGYGIMQIGGRKGRRAYSHRVAYETFVGAIPRELQIDHKCRVRCCINPAHLEAVTQLENIRRGDRHKKGTFNKKRKLRPCCAAGHSYVADNVYVDRRGIRRCRICQRGYHKTMRARRSVR